MSTNPEELRNEDQNEEARAEALPEDATALEGVDELDQALSGEVGEVEQQIETAVPETGMAELPEEKAAKPRGFFERLKGKARQLKRRAKEMIVGASNNAEKHRPKIEAIEQEIAATGAKIEAAEKRIQALEEVVSNMSVLKIEGVADRYQSPAVLKLIEESKQHVAAAKEMKTSIEKSAAGHTERLNAAREKAAKTIRESMNDENQYLADLQGDRSDLKIQMDAIDQQIGAIDLPQFDLDNKADRDRMAKLENPLYGNKEAYEKDKAKVAKLEQSRDKLKAKIQVLDEKIKAQKDRIASMQAELNRLEGTTSAEAPATTAEESTAETAAETEAATAEGEAESTAETTAEETAETAEEPTVTTAEEAEESAAEASDTSNNEDTETSADSTAETADANAEIGKELQEKMNAIEVSPGKGLEALEQFRTVVASYETLPRSTQAVATAKLLTEIDQYQSYLKTGTERDVKLVKTASAMFASEFSDKYGGMRTKFVEIMNQALEDAHDRFNETAPEEKDTAAQVETAGEIDIEIPESENKADVLDQEADDIETDAERSARIAKELEEAHAENEARLDNQEYEESAKTEPETDEERSARIAKELEEAHAENEARLDDQDGDDSTETSAETPEAIGKKLEQALASIDTRNTDGLKALEQFKEVFSRFEKIPTSNGDVPRANMIAKIDQITSLAQAATPENIDEQERAMKEQASYFSDTYGGTRSKLEGIVDKIVKDCKDKATEEAPEGSTTEAAEASTEETPEQLKEKLQKSADGLRDDLRDKARAGSIFREGASPAVSIAALITGQKNPSGDVINRINNERSNPEVVALKKSLENDWGEGKTSQQDIAATIVHHLEKGTGTILAIELQRMSSGKVEKAE